MMKSTIVLMTSALLALTMAHPATSPEYDLIVPRVNENGTNITTVEEPIPVFELPCDCPAAICNPMMNAKSICECKASAAQACYIRSAGGCAMPKVDAC
ncbi:hypothetical protein VP1G_00435 [Cytospora mali]|uniref:Extracellular membrane protein CFEM domain-containing protein n=1 Tax=Cytospora mali TaxID=578113 RepID=A0A194UN67_CYTMA|nr:hypothetical protein VP1G_00435 [Valsa mali var. pyri (nom. inval.)]